MWLRSRIVAVPTKPGVELEFMRSDSLNYFLGVSIDATIQQFLCRYMPKEAAEIRDLDPVFAGLCRATANPAVHEFVPNDAVEKLSEGSKGAVLGSHLTLPRSEIVQYSVF